MSHYLGDEFSNDNLRQHLALHLNGELYIVPDSFIMGDKVETLERLMDKKIDVVNNERRTRNAPLVTKDDLHQQETFMKKSIARLEIRKFEDLQIHPWLLNETA